MTTYHIVSRGKSQRRLRALFRLVAYAHKKGLKVTFTNFESTTKCQWVSISPSNLTQGVSP